MSQRSGAEGFSVMLKKNLAPSSDNEQPVRRSQRMPAGRGQSSFWQRAQGRIGREIRRGGVWLSRYRQFSAVKSFSRWVTALDDGLHNVGFDERRNGERALVRNLALSEGSIVMDVGANVGTYAAMVLEEWPMARVHAFEPNPDARRCIEALPLGITVVGAGLSNSQGTAELWMGHEADPAATLHRITSMEDHQARYASAVQIPLIRGDDYLDQAGIANVDLLKADVEGHEMRVFEGFGDSLKSVAAVQFEFGIFHIASGMRLLDFYDFFRDVGFQVGKLWPRGVEFGPYHFALEKHLGCNFVAVRDEALAMRLSNFSR